MRFHRSVPGWQVTGLGRLALTGAIALGTTPVVLIMAQAGLWTGGLPSSPCPEPPVVGSAKGEQPGALAQCVADALMQLSKEHRTVIIRAYYGGQSVAELAEELGMPWATVCSRMNHGLRALRLVLEEKGVLGP